MNTQEIIIIKKICLAQRRKGKGKKERRSEGERLESEFLKEVLFCPPF